MTWRVCDTFAVICQRSIDLNTLITGLSVAKDSVIRAKMSNVWLASAAITVKLNDKSKTRFSSRNENWTLEIRMNQKMLLRWILKRSIQWNSLKRRIFHQNFKYSTSTKRIHWVPVFVTMTIQSHHVHITLHHMRFVWQPLLTVQFHNNRENVFMVWFNQSKSFPHLNHL